MNVSFDVNVTDNTKAINDALDEQIEQALIAIGMTAESYAKMPVDKGGNMPVDTGRLKNSITYAIAGKPPSITSYSPDKDVKDDKESKPYSGNAPQDPGGKPRSVYIGSNVEYAAAVENGISGKQTGKHFLRSAVSDHTAEYKNLVEMALKGKG